MIILDNKLIDLVCGENIWIDLVKLHKYGSYNFYGDVRVDTDNILYINDSRHGDIIFMFDKEYNEGQGMICADGLDVTESNCYVLLTNIVRANIKCLKQPKEKAE